MSTKTILIGLVVIAIGAFSIQALIAKNKAADVQATINDLGTFNSANRESAVERFLGKPSVIFIVGTFCPHCQSAMPTYKTDIWDVYKDTVNIFANVTDGQSGKRFEVADIAQGVDAKLDYKTLVGEECNFVPSWVMLDAEGTVTDSSCGADKGVDVITAGLDAQLVTATVTE